MTAALENTSVLIVLFSATNFFDQACLSLDAPQRPGNEKGRRKRGALGGRSGCGAWIRTKDLRVMSPTSCRCSTPRLRLYPRLFGALRRQFVQVMDLVSLWATAVRGLVCPSQGRHARTAWSNRCAAPPLRRRLPS